MTLDVPSSLNSSISSSSFWSVFVNVGIHQIGKGCWIGFSTHLVLEYCEKVTQQLQDGVAISSHLGTLLVTSLRSVDLNCAEWLNTIYGDRREGATSEAVGILKERKKFSSCKVKWFNSYSKIDPSKIPVGETNFIRVGMFDPEVGDKFRSWHLGC